MRKIFKKIFFIFSVLVMLTYCVQPTYAEKLKLVQMSDIHFSTVRENNNYKLLARSKDLLQDAIIQINDMKNVDFVFITGDLIDQPNEESFEEVVPFLTQFKMPYYFALGNHDTTDVGSLSKERMLELWQDNNKNFIFNNLYYSFSPKKGYRVIVLDSVVDESSHSYGYIPQEQLDFLDKTLKKAKKEVVLVFMHHPLIEPYKSDDHKILNSDELYAILKQHKMPMAVFTGHYHATKIFKRNNMIVVSTPALVTYPHAFRSVIIDKKRKNTTFTFMFYETSLKDLQSKTKYLIFPKTLYTGRPQDRTCSFTIENKPKR